MRLGGGGMKGGQMYGETDDFSYNPVENPVHVDDLDATILRCLGAAACGSWSRPRASTSGCPGSRLAKVAVPCRRTRAGDCSVPAPRLCSVTRSATPGLTIASVGPDGPPGSAAEGQRRG